MRTGTGSACWLGQGLSGAILLIRAGVVPVDHPKRSQQTFPSELRWSWRCHSVVVVSGCWTAAPGPRIPALARDVSDPLCSPVDGPRFVFPVLGLDEWFSSSDLQVSVNLAWAFQASPSGNAQGRHTP